MTADPPIMAGGPGGSSAPAETDLLLQLRQASEGVSRAAGELYRHTAALAGSIDPETGELAEGVKSRWERALDNELIRIEEEALARNGRPPAVDIRQAIARRRAREQHPELYEEFLHRSATVEALQRWISAKKAVISALQSVLRGERE